LAVVFAGLLASTSALAAPRGAALVPSLKPSASPELRDRMHESVTRGLQNAGLEVIPAGEIRMRLGVSEEMMNCSAPGTCAARVGLLLRTDVMIGADIIINGKDYAIKLRAIDAAGREIGKLEDSCDICTVNEADQAVTRAVAKLATQVKTTLTEAASQPHTAEVTPPVVPPTPPKPETPATPPPTTAQPTPPPVTPPPVTPQPQPQKKGFPLKLVLGIASGVVGIIGISVGAYLVSIDGQPTCDAADPIHHCPSLYNTVGGGGALIGIGIAALGAAGALIYLEYRPTANKRAQVGITPTLGGAALTLSGRF
jgi:hypothetical protein